MKVYQATKNDQATKDGTWDHVAGKWYFMPDDYISDGGAFSPDYDTEIEASTAAAEHELETGWELTQQHFWEAYKRLSQDGHCDGAGGAEFRRVLEEWKAAGCPEAMDDFIKARANALPWD